MDPTYRAVAEFARLEIRIERILTDDIAVARAGRSSTGS